MRTIFKILLCISFNLIIIGCQNSVKKEELVIEKDFGRWDEKRKSLGVELIYDRFENWTDLLERTNRIVCNDSIPKITLKSDIETKTIYFHNPCWEDFACILIKQKNTIEIHNDIINKNDERFYPLDSLEGVLKKDYENNGKNPKLSDNPEKLLIYVSYDNNEFKNLPETLDKLTQAFELVANNTNIKIWLNKKFFFPTPPAPIEEIE